MKTAHLIICGLPVVFCLCAGALSFGDTQTQLAMDVSAFRPASNRYVLHVKITNTQNVPVSIVNVHLPWYTPNEFVLIPCGIRLDPKESLMTRAGPTSDYMHFTHTLAPGEFLEGDVNLHDMFPTLLRDVEKFGVIIEWSCKAKHITLNCKAGSGGSFLIPKGGGKPIEKGSEKVSGCVGAKPEESSE